MKCLVYCAEKNYHLLQMKAKDKGCDPKPNPSWSAIFSQPVNQSAYRGEQEFAMKDIKKILCAVDLSEHSKEVSEYAVLLAKGLNASVLVVYTAPSLSQYVGFHVPPNTIENFVGEIVTGAEKSMESFVAENFVGVEAKGQVLIGYAAEEILNRAREEKADLIVMGTHGRKGIDRILFGSVAEKVVKNADMPVLTVRPTEAGE